MNQPPLELNLGFSFTIPQRYLYIYYKDTEDRVNLSVELPTYLSKYYLLCVEVAWYLISRWTSLLGTKFLVLANDLKSVVLNRH